MNSSTAHLLLLDLDLLLDQRQDLLTADLSVQLHKVLAVLALQIVVGNGIHPVAELCGKRLTTELAKDHVLCAAANFFSFYRDLVVVGNAVLDKVPLQAATVSVEFFFQYLVRYLALAG